MTRRWWVAALAIVAVLAGCTVDDEPQADPNNPDQVEIVTSWATGTEQTALYDLIEAFESAEPDIQVIDASVRDADAARAAIAARLDAGNPPDIIVTPAGASLREAVASGLLQELSDLPEATAWIAEARPELAALVHTDGELYAVPAGIHRAGMLWVDTGVLTRAGVDADVAPATIDQWIADLERVRAHGVEYPLALGEPQTRLQLFEAVLVADLGVVGYQALWTNSATWEPRRLRIAVAHYARLLEFADPASGSLSWSDAVKRVTSGKAAYVLSSDAAFTVFRGAGFEFGGQYSGAPAPGGEGVFLLQAEAFAFPVGASHDAGARAWLAVAGSLDGQLALGAALGSIPTAAADDQTGDGQADDGYPALARAALREAVLVPSLSGGLAGSPAWTEAIQDAVVAYDADGRSEALVNTLVAAAVAELG